MTRTMRKSCRALVVASLAGALLSLPQVSLAAARNSGATAQAPSENPAASEAAARLDKKQYHDVKVSVENGIATLTGAVDLYEYKADAEKRVR